MPTEKDLLNALARDKVRLPKATVLHLCDQIAIYGRPRCTQVTAGAVVENILVGRPSIIVDHLRERIEAFPKMRIFVSGHTHKLEKRQTVKLNRGTSVDALNTGAFQRTVEGAGFAQYIADAGIPATQALHMINLEHLPACYTTVLIEYNDGLPEGQTLRWYMPEGGVG